MKTKKEMQARIEHLGGELIKIHQINTDNVRKIQDLKVENVKLKIEATKLRAKGDKLIRALDAQLEASRMLHDAALPIKVEYHGDEVGTMMESHA